MSLKTLKTIIYVILINPLNHLSSNSCTFIKKQCPADLLIPFVSTNGHDSHLPTPPHKIEK